MSLERQADADERLDVREIDGEPFGDIVSALEDLSDDETLLLVNSFEPSPLYEVLEQRGFAYDATNPEPNLWEIEITHA
jgi:uncharacterized protein (DUF2249 family)